MSNRGRQFKDKSKKTASRKQTNNSFIYGIHSVEAILSRRPEQIKSIWVQSGRQDQRIEVITSLAKQIGLGIQNTDSDTLDEMVNGERHQGVVADFLGGDLWTEDDLESLLSAKHSPAFIMVLDGVTDPHNLGACLRSANGAGVDVVIAPKDKAASITPVARKVACGAAESTPFIQVTNLSRTLRKLQDLGVWIVGLADEEDGGLFQSKLTGPTAIVLGSEGKGLRRLTRDLCDEICAIPMMGSVSSLNVSVAAGVCVYEVLRQRSEKSNEI